MSQQGAPKREVFEASKPDAIESLARIEGESNFTSLLAGIEAGRDTTQDMGASAFARARRCIPEVLEAHVAQSGLFRLPLLTMVFEAIVAEFAPRSNNQQAWDKFLDRYNRDKEWMRGAVADAFLLLRYGHCKPIDVRARELRVGHDVYGAVRKLADSIYRTLLADVERKWRIARFSGGDTSTNRHTANERGNLTPRQRAAIGSYRAGVRSLSDGSDDPYGQDEDSNGHNGIAPGVPDRLGWDEREAAKQPGPVLTYYGADAESYRLSKPAEPSLQQNIFNSPVQPTGTTQ